MTNTPISLQDPEEEHIRQGEGRTVLAFLGFVRPCL